MNINDAVRTRRSVRAFLDKPLPDGILRDVLALAARSPSGGNLQPWRLFVLSDKALVDFRQRMQRRLRETPEGEPVEYNVYPPQLGEPYRSERYKIGEQLYSLIGIPREDKAGRKRQFARNYDFFGAPAALFCFVDRNMGPPQWSDLGMYLQTVMLLLREHGLDSCPQECWSSYHQTVADFVNAPKEWMLFCGMAIGYADPYAPINQLASQRLPLEQFASFLDGKSENG